MCGMKIFLNKGNFAKIIDPCKMGSYGNVYVTICSRFTGYCQ